jgi:hypothetical protein
MFINLNINQPYTIWGAGLLILEAQNILNLTF